VGSGTWAYVILLYSTHLGSAPLIGGWDDGARGYADRNGDI